MAGSKKKILVVDDELKIIEVVRSYLENSGYAVYEAYDGKTALELFDKAEPSLVILDLMIPDISGEDICKALRRKSRVPIIMLTAKIEEESILKGFNIGADDYITKPFSPRQLVARVAALLRRTEDDVVPLADVLSFNSDELMIDNIKHEVRKNDDIIYLTPTEYKILMALVKYPKKAFTREELVCMALGDEYEGFDRVIDTHIKNLRQKLENNPKEPKYILTIHGIGYRFGGE
jgi:DNA-binding response OmpR family regulator